VGSRFHAHLGPSFINNRDGAHVQPRSKNMGYNETLLKGIIMEIQDLPTLIALMLAIGTIIVCPLLIAIHYKNN